MQPNRNDQKNLVDDLLQVIDDLLSELHPGKRRRQAITLDSTLDTDLGLDSLGRVELIARLEQNFNIGLPQRIFHEAETPRDLLRLISGARGRHHRVALQQIDRHAKTAVSEYPVQADNLLEVLLWHVQQHPDRLHIRVLEDEAEVTLTYTQLWQGAQQVATGLQRLGVVPGDTVIIMLPTGRDYFFSFMAILMTGAIPVPIYPPVRASQLEEHVQRHARILQNCQARYMITVPQAKVVATLLKSRVPSLREVVTVEDMRLNSGAYTQPVIGNNDIAFLQYTSGSTGNPKGVVLTHNNLLANIRVMGESVEATSQDVFVSWLPLYHDMGLIGAWLGSMYFAMEFVVMSPIAFITRPQRWLEAIHRYRGTLSAAPNFGYELCLKRISEEDVSHLDLHSWRLAFNGAEQVSPETIRRFSERFKSAGFRPETMQPVYGLAESSVGLAFPDIERPPLIDCVQREVFSETGKAQPADQADDKALCFVTCGQPLRGHEVRIVDEDNRELPEREQGYLQFKGPSATSGYYHNPEATKQLFKDDWLDSGDVAYMAGGNIFITGRSKDIIIRAGRNIYPHELEEAVGTLPGIRKGCVVAFGSIDPRTHSERLIIIAESRETDSDVLHKLEEQIINSANDLIGMPPDDVHLVAPHTILKTSSGKIRRSACKELYEQNRLLQTQSGLWVHFGRLFLTSVLPAGKRLWQKLMIQLFAAYAWALFGLLGFIGFVSVMLLPAMHSRWAVLRGLLRFLAFATRTRITVKGEQNLPDNPSCVYVANHASYIDALVMIAVLPRHVGFVGKIELSRQRLLRLFLSRMQVEFVERFEQEQAMIDAQRLTQKAKQAQSLFFFAEGTFTRAPGLREFYMGAFLTAAQADIPIIPIALRGTRSILRSGSWFPRHGHVSVNIGEAIASGAAAVSNKEIWTRAIVLRDAARAHIAQHCGEPDLMAK